MIDNDQITALAREYAEERASIMQGSLTTKIQAELVIRFLLRRFCLVEKEVIREEYSKATAHVEEAIKSKSPLSESCGKGKRLAILSLFPDLGKEVDYPW